MSPPGTAMVVAAPRNEQMLCVTMGNEVVTVYVGVEKQMFVVHKQLFGSSGGFFTKYFNTKLKSTEKYVLHDVSPTIFEFFVEYLYTRRIPCVISGSDKKTMAFRVHWLCQFFAFSEKFLLEESIRNRIMDAIQDGFLAIGCTPEPALARNIYENTTPGSKLRKFCAASLVYLLQSDDYVENGAIASLINENDDIMDDFLAAIRGLGEVGRDPRVRACGGDLRCAECIESTVHHQAHGHGFWPCAFHYHPAANAVKAENISEANIYSEAGDLMFGQGCYLRRDV